MHARPSQSDCSRERSAVELLYRQGFRLHADERYAEAAAVFRAMLRLAPTDERGWLALGDCHERAGQRRIALELYSAGSIAADPAPRCHLSRFRTLYDLDRTTEAEDAYERAAAIASRLENEALLAVMSDERRARP